MDLQNLKELLLAVADRRISHSQASRLVQISRTMIQAHLNYKRASVYMLCSQLGQTVADIAWDCIAEVFARNAQDEFYLLNNFFSSLRCEPHELPESELFLAFKSFLIRLADAQLARLCAKTDPAGAKISRNIRERAAKSNLFYLEKDFRGMVLAPLHIDQLDYLEPFPGDELEAKFFAEAQQQLNVDELLHSLHTILKQQSCYRRTLLLYQVVQLFKRFYQRGDDDDLTRGHLSAPDGLSDFEIEDLRAKVELALKEKIFYSYLLPNKVNRLEALSMLRAFDDMLGDWCSGDNGSTTLHEYLNRHLPHEREEYENFYRPKMEYLLKIAREEFTMRLIKDF